MKLPILFLVSLCVFQLHGQGNEIFAVRDSICITQGDPIMYNVKENDELFVTDDFPVFLTTQTSCFILDFEGNLMFNPDGGDCCGEHHLTYRYEGCQQPSVCEAEIIIIVKCPKPDCSIVDLSEFIEDETDPIGGNSMPPDCLISCENSAATYFLPYDAANTYSWSVLGGLSSPGANPAEINVTWGAAGTGSISLITTNASNETTILNFCVEILEGPTADFTKSADTICLNSTVYFTNNSLNGNSWFWDFGDGSTSNAYSPSHQYTTPGTYPVLLTVTKDNYGPNGEPLCCCTDTMSMDVIVEALEGPEIYWISTLCAGDSSKYWTNATNCSSYVWTVLDENDVPIPFVGQGNDTICVQWGNGPFGQISLDASGCDDAYCSQPTTVIVPIISPNAPIDGLTEVCENDIATYSAPKWTSVVYDWQISGGSILSGQGTNTIVVQWGTAPGPGTIMLNYASDFLGGLPGQDPNDCGGSANLSVDIKPAFDITGQTFVCVESSSSFSATSLPSASYNWTISPAVSFTGQGTNNINITWDAGPGTFLVTAVPNDLTVYCNDEVTMAVQVVETPEPTGIDGPIEICPNETATYFGQTSETGVGFFWIVTGGVPASTLGNPLVVTWNPTGPYNLALRQFSLADPFCMSDSIQLNVTQKLLNGPITITGPDGCTNETQAYSAGPTQHPDADFQWTISPVGAGSVVSGQGSSNIMVQWNDTPGTPTLQLTVSLCGNSFSANLPVTLNNATPPTITQSGVLCPGVPATLDAGPGYSSYSWSTFDVTQTISITSGGTYLVTVTNAGCSAIGTYTANELEGPVASISTPDQINMCSNTPFNTGSVTLTALTGVGYTYDWFCDGISQGFPSTQTFLTHNNTQTPGVFNYWVVVTDSNGCTNQSNTITVTQSPCPEGPGGGCEAENYNLSFTAINGTPQCDIVDFTVFSSANVTLLGWDFNDPSGDNTNTGTLDNATHNYTTAGCYLVTLTASVPSVVPGEPDCIVEATAVVCVPLAANFSATVDCLDVTFCDLSTFLPGQGPANWSWNFGDGNTSTALKPTHTYAAGGTYTVTFGVRNTSGCGSVWTETITVDGPPIPTISSSPSPACVGTPINFTATGTGIISWLWNFDDGSTNGGQNPGHTYLSPNSYNVTLDVVDEQGCTNTVSLALDVFPNPPNDTIAWTPSLTVCDGEVVTLTAPAGPGYTYLWSPNGETTASINVATAGTYGVIVTDANGCTLTPDPVTVTILPLPPAIISGPNVICDDGCIQLQASMGQGYSYQWYNNGGNLMPGEISAVLTVCDFNLASPYTVEITDANGCSNTSATHVVTLESAPVFTVAVMPDPCEGSPSILTVTPVQPDVVYSWNTGETGTSITVLQAGLYTAIGTDTLTGCKGSASATIHPLPDLCLVPVGCYESCNPDTICGPPGLAAYQWNMNGTPIIGATGECLIVDQSGSYSLTGTTDFGCSLTSDSLILEIINCGCDGLDITATPSPTDSCCWTLSYDNLLGIDLIGMNIYTNDANLDINASSIHDSLMISSSTVNSVSLAHIDGLPLPTGTISDFLEFCFSDIQNMPQQVIIDWYDFDFEVACSDTLYFDCPIEPDCLYMRSDSIYCEGNQVVYNMTVCNPVDAAYPIGYIDLLALNPAGIVVTPPNIDLTGNEIAAGECRTFSFNLNGSNIAGEMFCYNLIAHSDNPMLVDTALCCSIDTMYCIEIPDCDPCDDIGVEYVDELSMDEGACCFAIGLYNNYQPNYFDGIGLCVISDETTITINNPFGSGWTTTASSPTAIQLAASPPLGTTLPLGLITLPDICIQTTASPEQLVEIKWLIGDSIVCRDTVSLFCEPPCGYILEEIIDCDPATGGWFYSGIIKNTSAFTMGEADIVFTAPAGMNGYNINIPLGALPPGGTFPFTMPIGAPAVAGDTICFTVALHEFGDNDTHENCCNFSHCTVLEDCSLPAPCVCDDNFLEQVSLGINCSLPTSNSTYFFSPQGNFLDCDDVTWDLFGPTGQSTTSTGNEEISFIINDSGDYMICMKVTRIDDNGTLCEDGFCKDLPVPEPGPDPTVDPVAFPNPASDEVVINLPTNQSFTDNIHLLDMLGKVAHSFTKPGEGAESTRLNISSVQAGVYWLRIEADGKQYLKKLVVI